MDRAEFERRGCPSDDRRRNTSPLEPKTSFEEKPMQTRHLAARFFASASTPRTATRKLAGAGAVALTLGAGCGAPADEADVAADARASLACRSADGGAIVRLRNDGDLGKAVIALSGDLVPPGCVDAFAAGSRFLEFQSSGGYVGGTKRTEAQARATVPDACGVPFHVIRAGYALNVAIPETHLGGDADSRISIVSTDWSRLASSNRAEGEVRRSEVIVPIDAPLCAASVVVGLGSETPAQDIDPADPIAAALPDG
jgi:hypothetical protein